MFEKYAIIDFISFCYVAMSTASRFLTHKKVDTFLMAEGAMIVLLLFVGICTLVLELRNQYFNDHKNVRRSITFVRAALVSLVVLSLFGGCVVMVLGHSDISIMISTGVICISVIAVYGAVQAHITHYFWKDQEENLRP